MVVLGASIDNAELEVGSLILGFVECCGTSICDRDVSLDKFEFGKK